MGVVVHHTPVDKGLLWNIHVWKAAWDGNIVSDTQGTLTAGTIDFQLPDSPDPRKLQFKFHAIDSSGQDTWEDDNFVRRLFLSSPSEVWTFASSPRIVYQNPFPAGVAFQSGDVLTFRAISKSRFSGGRIYAWSPSAPQNQNAFFDESARDDATSISTFQVVLQPWMTSGFNLKLMKQGTDGNVDWEPDSSNRVWRPCDGASLWLKSGQCDVRSEPLTATTVGLEMLYSASLAGAPQLTLNDSVENLNIPLTLISTGPYSGSSLFNVASYEVSIFPQASYTVANNDLENPPVQRPFPADPTDLDAVSRCALGASAWLNDFPVVTPIPLWIQPLPASSFSAGLSVQASIGNGPPYEKAPATLQSDGTWQATPNLALNTTTAIDLIPAAGSEPKPYDWIDTSRYFTPAATTLHVTEGVYGICMRGGTQFADPPDRAALMRSVFGDALVSAGIFAPREMPHGATVLGNDIYFVVHAPHAVCATLILVAQNPAAGAVRKEFPMTLTSDTFYWWCKLPVSQAPAGTRYRFLLNDDVEVIDPAARDVLDGGSLKTSFGDDPNDSATSWSLVLDAAAVKATAHVQPWQTMGWQNLLIYEIHVSRFSGLQQGSLTSFDLLVDELNPTSRLGKPGYLRQLPVTAFGLMPVNEFNSRASWGYDPSFYFAIDGFYGGSAALARFVNTAHTNGRGVMLDLVYNHSLGSSLMSIAPDVYRNGDYDGDRMNCGHPMVAEYFRQASVYLFQTFDLDGFRFDDTQTIVTKCQGGWEFLSMIRSSLRAAADAEGRRWPYCVAENSATNPWDISDPSTGVMDGQWGIDEVYRIKDASYDSWNSSSDDAARLKGEMDKPAYWGRPFFQATRFGESHDMVSAQDAGNKRIAARPPLGQGCQMAKALGTLTLLSNGIPMLFMGQEVGETMAFSFDQTDQTIDPQNYDVSSADATDNTRILAWFRQLMGLRNDASKGLQGDANYQVVATANRTVAFTCGANQNLFVVVTFGTSNQQQDSSWLGLPAGSAYKEIFNSSWPDFQVELESEQTNGGYDARISSGQILNLPFIGALVLERA